MSTPAKDAALPAVQPGLLSRMWDKSKGFLIPAAKIAGVVAVGAAAGYGTYRYNCGKETAAKANNSAV